MVDLNSFRGWLSENTDYSHDVIIDILSRAKRADKMLTWTNEDIYEFRLEHHPDFKLLPSSVRSQIKKAIKLYSQFYRTEIRKNVMMGR